MAKIDKFEVVKLSELPETPTRGLAFLDCATRKDINAKAVFDKLKAKIRQDVLNRFDYWLDEGICDKYFHGFPNHPVYHQCLVFKWKQAGSYHRLYGFLSNPRPLTQRGFRSCVLVSHAQKNTANTDPSELAHAESLRLNLAVMTEVKKAYPERKK